MKDQVVSLDTINVESLPELIGWKEKQEELVKENPFIEITDNTTFTEAKRRRTALVKGRTTIQAQDKLIASKLKDFRQKVADVSQKLIDITLEHEEKQQAEVKRYEDLKEQERIEKERLEEERKKAIRAKIESVFEEWKTNIANFTFDEINEINIIEKLSDIDTSEFEDFVDDFNSKTRVLTDLFYDRRDFLLLKEEQRIENERLEAERKKLEEERRIESERLAAERKKLEEEQKALNEKRRLEDEERNKEIAIYQAEMEAERERMKAEALALEKQRLEQQKIEQARIEEENKKAEAIRLEKERLEAEKEEKKRLKEIEALKPDKEKLLILVNSISVSVQIPTLKSAIAKKFESDLELGLVEFKNNLLVELEKL